MPTPHDAHKSLHGVDTAETPMEIRLGRMENVS